MMKTNGKQKLENWGVTPPHFRRTPRGVIPPLQNSESPKAKLASKLQTFGTSFASFGRMELARAYLLSKFLHAGHQLFPATIFF